MNGKHCVRLSSLAVPVHLKDGRRGIGMRCVGERLDVRVMLLPGLTRRLGSALHGRDLAGPQDAPLRLVGVGNEEPGAGVLSVVARQHGRRHQAGHVHDGQARVVADVADGFEHDPVRRAAVHPQPEAERPT